MGVKWTELPAKLREIIENCVTERYPRMITQGVSNTMYGLGVMGITWENMSPAHREAAHVALIGSFGSRSVYPVVSSQGVANVLYALGLSGASWDAFPSSVHRSLLEGVILCGPHFKSQEVSNLIYG